MNKYILIALLLLGPVIAGCAKHEPRKDILARINKYELTQQEFEEEFRNSPFGQLDTPESRKEFLNNLIDRKLILQEAQARGLDKKEDFLRAIEKFWEQSLLRISLDTKNKEIAGSVQVSDKLIQDTYHKMLKDGKTDKFYEEMYQQLKWEILKIKESEAMDAWVASLRKKALIKVNDALLATHK